MPLNLHFLEQVLYFLSGSLPYVGHVLFISEYFSSITKLHAENIIYYYWWTTEIEASTFQMQAMLLKVFSLNVI